MTRARPPAQSQAHARTPLAGAYVSKKLRELDAALVLAIPRVVESSDDEAIHDLRVAIRRLRTMLKMARVLYGRWRSDVVRRAYADVMRATGDLRDEEVLEETLEGVSDDPTFHGWVAARKTRERKLRRAVVARIERGDLDKARLLLKALLVFPLEPKRDMPLARFARRTVERARRGVEAKRDAPPDDVVALHDLRIAYKELRYSIELLAEALPLDARAMLEPATVFQKRLGEIHDVDVALEAVKHARLPAASRDLALSGLEALRAKKLAKYLRELDPIGAAAAPPVLDEARLPALPAEEGPEETGRGAEDPGNQAQAPGDDPALSPHA